MWYQKSSSNFTAIWWDFPQKLNWCQSHQILQSISNKNTVIWISEVGDCGKLLHFGIKNGYFNDNCEMLIQKIKCSGGSRGGGPNRPLAPPPPFWGRFFFFFFYFLPFHPGGWSGRRTVPIPHNVRPGAASRHLDSRPSLFTNPGSATEMDAIIIIIIMIVDNISIYMK